MAATITYHQILRSLRARCSPRVGLVQAGRAAGVSASTVAGWESEHATTARVPQSGNMAAIHKLLERYDATEAESDQLFTALYLVWRAKADERETIPPKASA